MKFKKSLLLSIWGIAIGIILWISGEIVGGMGIVYHEGGWFTSSWFETTWVYDLGVGLAWAGIVVLILSAFGVGTTFLREFLERENKTAQSPSTQPQ